MSIQIRQIKGDIVELLFNPKEEDLRVGENLSLREKGSDRGLIVQVIEFRTVNYPALLQEMLQLVAEDPESQASDLSDFYQDGLPEMSNLKLAIAKIRKVVTWANQMVKEQVMAVEA
jgi:hypothetical protein